MFEKQIKIFKGMFKIYEDIGEEFKASAYREIYIKLQILDGNKDFLKSCEKDLDCCFKNSFTKIENLKFEKTSNSESKNRKLCFYDLFTQKTIFKILEIEKSGKLEIFEDLKSRIEIQNIQILTKIFGVGPATAKKLIGLSLTDFNKYKLYYTNYTKIQKIGIKYNSINILDNSYRVTKKVVNLIISNLEKGESVHLAGSYRGKSENPSDIDLIICNKFGSIQKIIKILEDNNLLKDYVKSGPGDIMGIIEIDKKFYRIDIKCTTPKYLASCLLYFGSGKYFSKYIRKIAKNKGYKLNQYGIENLKNGDVHVFGSERSIFKFLGMFYITPEDRFKYW